MRARAATTLKLIPCTDLALPDPLVGTFVTRNHAMMVVDTLYTREAAGMPRPQVVGIESVEDGGRRDGLTFHDGAQCSGGMSSPAECSDLTYQILRHGA